MASRAAGAGLAVAVRLMARELGAVEAGFAAGDFLLSGVLWVPGALVRFADMGLHSSMEVQVSVLWSLFDR
jgi:hypothetical protein